MTGELILQAPGFCQVVEQYQLAGLGIQRAGGNRQTPPVFKRHLMAVIFAGSEAAGDYMAPQLALQRQAKQLAGGRVGLAHPAAIINDDDPARQQIKEVLQAVGQPFFLGQLRHALGADKRQLAFKLADPGFEQTVGVAQLGRHLIELRERLLQLRRGGGSSPQRHGLPCEIRARGLLGNVRHGTFSLG